MVHELAGNIIRFSNNTAGIEKILKGIIGVLLFPATPTGKSLHPLSARATTKLEAATKEVSVARKVVRFLWFLDSALKAFEARRGGKTGPLKWLIMGKWGFACIYAASEAITILHSMGVLNNGKSRWSAGASRKGNKFYFFSIFFSILASAYQLFEITMAEREIRKAKRKLKPHAHPHGSSSSSSSSSDSSSSESENEKARKMAKEAAIKRALHQDGYPAAASPVGSVVSAASPTLQPSVLTSAEQRLANAAEWERKKLFVDAARTSGTSNEEAPHTGPIVTQLMADICDLAIPASKVGWYNNKEAVSAAYVVNSLLAGSVIWGRVNAKSAHHDQHHSHGHNGPIQMVKKV
ncbi:hypothetical protein ABW19_dt0204614 [Dactylella cylindrospora]|nr:hypothetical protein ABW19_dt0204614 [Dactylella cylindrospora]